VSNKISGIDNNRTAPVGAGRAVERVKDVTSPDREPASVDASDVDITGTARQLAALEKTLNSQPAIDEARVAQVRSAIEQGHYRISPERVADGLIQIEHALGHLEY
jgi:negative regulator of flagellin synthesis FlgM